MSLIPELLRRLLDLYPGWKTYLAGVGLVGLGLYQLSQGLVSEGIASIVAGVGLITGRRAIERQQPV